MKKINIFIQNKTNELDKKMNQKICFYIWKISRIINWIILLIFIPLLPILFASFGFDLTTGMFEAEILSWAMWLSISIFIIFAINLIVIWWFSKFSDYKKENAN